MEDERNPQPRESQPALFGEIALMLWLVIKGAKPVVQDPAGSSSSLS